jgi:hypothetical protein
MIQGDISLCFMKFIKRLLLHGSNNKKELLRAKLINYIFPVSQISSRKDLL